MWLIWAMLAAIFFGLRGILYHWSSKRIPDRNLLLFGVFFTGTVVSLLGTFTLSQQWSVAALTGVLMGIFSFVANSSMFMGFATGKASLIAILTALPAVIVVIFAYFLWGEALTYAQMLSFIIIIAGLLLVRYSNDLKKGNLQGAQWGLLALIFFAFNDLSTKWSTKLGADMFPTLFFMFVTGSLLFAGGWLLNRKSLQIKQVDIRTFLIGMVVGMTNLGGMIFILSAFRDGITGLVSAVVATNVVIVLLYTRLFLQERFKKVELWGICIALLGMVVLHLSNQS